MEREKEGGRKREGQTNRQTDRGRGGGRERGRGERERERNRETEREGERETGRVCTTGGAESRGGMRGHCGYRRAWSFSGEQVDKTCGC